jgi:glycerol uptake facilitator-like aquaporin
MAALALKPVSVAQPNTQDRVPTRRWLCVLGVLLGCFMAVLNIVLTNSSLRDIAGSLGASADEISCTSPAIRNYPANLLCEIIATFVLVIVAGAMNSKLVLSGGAAAGVSPYLISCVAWGIGISLGGTTGYAINPARDLAPRAAHAALPIAGKGGSDWRYAWMPVLGPAIGPSQGASCFICYMLRPDAIAINDLASSIRRNRMAQTTHADSHRWFGSTRRSAMIAS